VNKVTTGTVETATGETLYVRLGDWVVLASGIVLAALAVVAVRRGRPKPAS
jgi:apolipoprotein N-acyltransferase